MEWQLKDKTDNLTELISLDWSKKDAYSFIEDSVVRSLRRYPMDDMSIISPYDTSALARCLDNEWKLSENPAE
jgi:hypothetical protein